MIYKVFGDTIVVRLERGEEIISSLMELCNEKNITGGAVTGIGAVDHVVIGLYKVDEKKYYSNTFDMEMEITGLMGNISVKDNEPYLHLHGNFADSEGKVFGGHLNEARISATCEIVINRIKGSIGRKFDDSIGLNVIDF